MLKWLSRSFFFGLGAVLGTGLGLRFALRLAKAPTPPQLAFLLDSPLRHLYRDPAVTLDLVGVYRNAVVLDAGCGSGTYTLEAARRVGSGGHVYCVDCQAAMINVVARKIERAGLENVTPAISPLHRLPLNSGNVDTVLMISTLSEVSNWDEVLIELKRVLKPGGLLVVGEELLEAQYLRPQTVQRWVEAGGFKLTGRSGNAFSYLLKFVKPVSAIEVVSSQSGAARAE